jgi:hypothetical protein
MTSWQSQEILSRDAPAIIQRSATSMRRPALPTLCLAVLSLAVASTAFAQRKLRWDSIEVSAQLGAAATAPAIRLATVRGAVGRQAPAGPTADRRVGAAGRPPVNA